MKVLDILPNLQEGLSDTRNYQTIGSKLFENTNLANLEQEVDRYLAAGEIINPEYLKLKSQINRSIEKESRPMRELVSGTSDMYDIEEALGSLWYDLPASTNEVLALKNKLARVKTKEGRAYPYFKGLEEFYKKYSALAEKFKKLKDKVVKVAVKRQQAKDEKATVMRQKFTDSKSMVEVLTQHIDEYKARAVKMAGDQITFGLGILERASWSLNEAAPYPKPSMARDAYRAAVEKRNLLESISDSDGNDRDKRKASPSKRKAKEDEAEKNAHVSYMAWVAKMIDKIGKTVEKAAMTGSPWNGSTLRVTTNDGEEQVWDNKMIINQSKYGTLFNQFPSRRIK